MAATLSDQAEEVYQEFYDLVNMQPKEIEDWLDTDEAKSVGQTKDGEDESVGYQSGKKIIEIKRTNKDELSDDQIDHMRKVCGYIKRHKAQRPDGDVEDTDWCFSLKNWGHDPTK
ncbi:DUF3140 domain-containing protein [Rhodopirellula sp. JC740]|uniref:DUF3140 domain-containing protein n=2 Tax=Rhodopirellula halodulae TaxID=2894198 RepID=A0ABS8NEM4_9BACT|nr:DUF3140 domain-containing protein [Rhodopirellula sp. JC740]MCC9642001.1 DUF3140 domain-containing protein [Rhodopirellula sp. JC740]MCC9658387.1 DUF3140 domain-containing protein [Rhodopirellula sp. JC737]